MMSQLIKKMLIFHTVCPDKINVVQLHVLKKLGKSELLSELHNKEGTIPNINERHQGENPQRYTVVPGS